MIIRPFRQGDRAAVKELWRLAGLTVWYNDPDADLDLYLESPNSQVLVAESDAGIIGSICVGSDGHRAYVYYVASHPDHRQQGIGRLLMESAEAWAKAHHVPKLQLMIRPTNTKVRAFYEALGYHAVATRLMVKWLKDPYERFQVPLFERVTNHLQMTANPAWQAMAPSNLRLALLHAEKMEPAFYSYLQEEVGAPHAWRDRRGLSHEKLMPILEDPLNEVYVLHANGSPAGFFELDCHDDKAVKLVFFGLTPRWLGQGLGRYLMRQALDAAWRRGPERVLLSTDNLDHPKALAFYQRAGFEIVSQDSETIPDPRVPMP